LTTPDEGEGVDEQDDSFRQPDVDEQDDPNWKDDRDEVEDSLDLEISARSKVKLFLASEIPCFVLYMFCY
jgi:hypothetical protein